MQKGQYYRIDKAGLKAGQFRLTVTIETTGVIERKDGTPRELHVYRELHYPLAHSYRHHFDGEIGCPVCDMNHGQAPMFETTNQLSRSK